jgi:hypothetical protein
MKYILFINELWVKIPQNTIVCYDETSYIFKYENIEFD